MFCSKKTYLCLKSNHAGLA